MLGEMSSEDNLNMKMKRKDKLGRCKSDLMPGGIQLFKNLNGIRKENVIIANIQGLERMIHFKKAFQQVNS